MERDGNHSRQVSRTSWEHPRPHYPVAALYHAGLWDIAGPRPVPPAHGNAPLRWFASNQPASGLLEPVYNLVRYSGEARVAAAAP